METVFLKTIIGNKKYLVRCVYRPLSSNMPVFLNKLRDLLQFIHDSYRGIPVILSGDFNVDIFNSNIYNAYLDFISLMFSNNMLPTIIRPTRIGSKSASLIDHFWTNNYNKIGTSSIGILLSDHYAIYNSFLTENREVSGFLEIKRRLNSQDRIAALNTALTEVDWSGVMSQQSAEQTYNEFITKITDNYNFLCPLVTHKVKKSDLAKPYSTNDLKLAIKEKHCLQKLYNKWPITYAEQYKRFRNSLISKLRTTKSNYIRNKQISTDCVLSRNKFEDSSSQFLINRALTDDSLEIVEGFNEHFSSLGDNLAAAFLPGDDGYLQYLNDDFEHLSFNFEPTNPEEVTRLVLTMKEASPGWDGVPMKVLKII